MTTKCSNRDPERGSALLEFGLIAIALFTFIFGIIDFGRALFAYHFVANAAREGTRYASVRGYDCGQSLEAGTMDCPASQTTIQTYLQNEALGSGLNQSLLNVTANWYPTVQSPNNPAVCAQTPNYPGCTVQVQVSYPFRFIFPFLPTSAINMSSTSAMVITQ